MKYVFKIVLTILITITMTSFSNANSLKSFTLNCKMTNYDYANLLNKTSFSLKQIQSFISPNYIYTFK